MPSCMPKLFKFNNHRKKEKNLNIQYLPEFIESQKEITSNVHQITWNQYQGIIFENITFNKSWTWEYSGPTI